MGMLSIVLFIVGFYILVKGAELLVDGAVTISKSLGLSQWVVGVLVVGIGTSIPEFSINVFSALKQTDIGVATLFGGNTFNILFVLGLSAIISPAVVRREWVYRDFIINIISVLVAFLALVLPLFGDPAYLGITVEEALGLFALFLAWVFFMLKRKPMYSSERATGQNIHLLLSFGMIGAGFAGVFFGADWVVSGALSLASVLGIHAHIVGLSFVAIGTSFPELVVSIVAAFKGQTEIAVGNIIGSNIFDFVGILGTAGLISQIPFDSSLLVDVSVTLLSSSLLFFVMFTRRKYVLTRSAGVVFITLYFFYFATIVLRVY